LHFTRRNLRFFMYNSSFALQNWSCRKTKVTFLINTFTGSTLPKPDK
jgi:hypothetical protein